MWRINKYGVEPGTYVCGLWEVVVTEIVTHELTGENGVGGQTERTDPLVVFRELHLKIDKYVTYSMVLSEFKKRFIGL